MTEAEKKKIYELLMSVQKRMDKIDNELAEIEAMFVKSEMEKKKKTLPPLCDN